MNKERILLLAEAIEQSGRLAEPELGFNMNYFWGFVGGKIADFARRPCGTVACIAGHASQLAGFHYASFGAAGKWLGLEPEESAELFYPGDTSGLRVFGWDTITPTQAGAVLRRLAETGEVDWTAVLPEDMFSRPGEGAK